MREVHNDKSRNTMKNKILNLIESNEVRDCLSDNYDQLSKKQIIDIIYGAPCSLTEKYSVFRQLADEEKDSGKISYTEYAQRLSIELSQLNLSDNEMFILELKRLPKSDNSFSVSYPLGVFSDTAKSLDVIKRKFIIDKLQILFYDFHVDNRYTYYGKRSKSYE